MHQKKYALIVSIIIIERKRNENTPPILIGKIKSNFLIIITQSDVLGSKRYNVTERDTNHYRIIHRYNVTVPRYASVYKILTPSLCFGIKGDVFARWFWSRRKTASVPSSVYPGHFHLSVFPNILNTCSMLGTVFLQGS